MILKDNGFEVESLAASASPYNSNDTVLTIRARYPRIVLAELNTHAGLAKNSGSSRAIPIEKMIASADAMPVRFGGNQPGMQDKGEEHKTDILIPDDLDATFTRWLISFENKEAIMVMLGEEQLVYMPNGKTACGPRTFWRFMAWVNSLGSRSYSEAGYHKQIANRLTEAYQWMNTVISGTTDMWKHFLWLRDHPAADPTIQKLAGMIRDLRNQVEFVRLEPGEWHLPYILPEEKGLSVQKKLVYSTARIARVSYAPFDGAADWDKELKRHNLLVLSEPPHASPTEHPCTPMLGRWGKFEGFVPYRSILEGKINGKALLQE